MSNKAKRHILLPSAIIIYIAVMAVISFPRYRESGNWAEYFAILGICILIAIFLYLILKRKKNVRDKFNRKD